MNYGYQQPEPQKQPPTPEVTALADKAFGKGLAAAIMSCFPIASIVAIFLGFSARALGGQAAELADYMGCERHGKGVAGRILGNIGGILGIVMTVLYILAFVIGIIAGTMIAENAVYY